MLNNWIDKNIVRYNGEEGITNNDASSLVSNNGDICRHPNVSVDGGSCYNDYEKINNMEGNRYIDAAKFC